MPTLPQLNSYILRGKLLQSSLAGNAITAEQGGFSFKGWGGIFSISSLVRALQSKVNDVDYNSSQTIAIYNNLTCRLGLQFIDGASINPNAQIPGITIDVINSGFEPTELTFTEANLIDDGFGGYYLPVTGGTGLVIVSVTSNGVAVVGLQASYNFNPPRLYGFANNASQVIIVTLI